LTERTQGSLYACVCECVLVVYQGGQRWLANLTNIPMRQEGKGFAHFHWPLATLSLSHTNLSSLFEHSCAVSYMKENSRSSTQEVGAESQQHKSALQLSRTVFLDRFQPQCRDCSLRSHNRQTDRQTQSKQQIVTT